MARIKVDEKNCFGVIEWQAEREAASRFLPKHTAAWKTSERDFCWETLMAHWSAAWLWAWWQRRREEALPHGRRRAPFLGLG